MYKLTQSGLLTSDREDEVLSDLIKRFKDSTSSSKTIIYDQASGELVIKIKYNDSYTIKLDNEQKFKYENGISDPNLNQIRDLIKFNDARLFAEQTIEEARTGDLPVTASGINAYSRHLNKEILKSGAVIAKRFVISFWPVLLLVSSIHVWKLAVEDFNSINGFLWFCLGVTMDLIGFVRVLFKLFEFSEEHRIIFLETLKEQLKKIKINQLKKQDLKSHTKELSDQQGLEKITDSYNSFVSNEKKLETDKAIEYNDETLKEIRLILDLIEQLPEEEQGTYSERIISITKEYQEKIIEIINNNRGLVFGEASNTQELRFNMMPRLIAIRSEIEEKLQAKKRVEKVTEECESIISAAEESAYNEWSDDLTEGNMMKKA